MKHAKHWVFLALISVCSCGLDPASTQARIHGESDLALVQDYYYAKPATCVGNYYCDDIRNELHARNIIPANDWPIIDAHQVAIGMTTQSVEASWGPPTEINSTTTAIGTEDQWVYRPCDTCTASYVYLEGGLVTAIQN